MPPPAPETPSAWRRADIVPIGDFNTDELVPACRGRRRHVGFAPIDAEMKLAVDIIYAGAVGLRFGHGVQHAGGSHGVDDRAGTAAIDDTKLLLSRRRLTCVVHDLGSAIGGVGDAGELADDLIHITGSVFSGGMVRDQGIEAGNSDLVVGNGANDGGSRGLVHTHRSGSRNRDLDRHADAARDK